MPEPIALIGAGVIGRRHLQAIAQSDAVRLVAIVDPMPQARALADDWGVPIFTETEAMLANQTPAGVIVATPTAHHVGPTQTALRAGAHVLVEKPIAATVEEAKAMAALAQTTSRHVLVGHHRRYYPQIETAREMIQGGAIGRLVAVTGQWSVRKPPDYYAQDWRRAWHAGPVLTNLIHEMDYLRYICGDIDAVQAELGHWVQGFEKEDVAAFTLRFASGALAAFALSDQADSPWAWEFATGENAAFPRSGENCIRFVGTDGALDFPNLRLWTSQGAPDWTSAMAAEDHRLDLGDAFVAQIAHFAQVIAGNAPPKITAQDATQTLRATLAVLEAGRSGRRITL